MFVCTAGTQSNGINFRHTKKALRVINSTTKTPVVSINTSEIEDIRFNVFECDPGHWENRLDFHLYSSLKFEDTTFNTLLLVKTDREGVGLGECKM